MDSPEHRQPPTPAFVVPGGDEPATIPTCDEGERIVAVAEPIVRSLQITQCYHELSHPLAANLGAAANWCTFATWASKQAGQTIRQEDLRRIFTDYFRLAPHAAEAFDRAAALPQQMQAQRAAVDLHAPKKRLTGFSPSDSQMAQSRALLAIWNGHGKGNVPSLRAPPLFLEAATPHTPLPPHGRRRQHRPPDAISRDATVPSPPGRESG